MANFSFRFFKIEDDTQEVFGFILANGGEVYLWILFWQCKGIPFIIDRSWANFAPAEEISWMPTERTSFLKVRKNWFNNIITENTVYVIHQNALKSINFLIFGGLNFTE
jgi:hypothetical protein